MKSKLVKGTESGTGKSVDVSVSIKSDKGLTAVTYEIDGKVCGVSTDHNGDLILSVPGSETNVLVKNEDWRAQV